MSQQSIGPILKGVGSVASGVAGGVGGAVGSTGTMAETARPSADFVGPMPGERTGAAGGLGMIAKGWDKLQGFANFLGDTPEERAQNAKMFAAMVKDVGNIGKSMADSTLMQRMMKESMNQPTVIPGPQPSGGVAAMGGGGKDVPVMSTSSFR